MELEKIGRWISQLRKEKGYTQKELAQQLSVTDKAVSRWETGKGLPDTAVLKELSEALGVSVGELLAGERLEKLEEREQRERGDALLLEALRYSKGRLAKMVNGALLTVGILLMLSPLVTAGTAAGLGAALCGAALAGLAVLRMILSRRQIQLRLGEKGWALLGFGCLWAALFLELLPWGAVLNFARPEGEPFRQTYSYFSLTPFGYANFTPLLTGLLTAAACLLSVLCLLNRGKSARLRNGIFVVSVVLFVLSLVPLLLFGPAYMTAVSYGVTGLTAASALLQAVANRKLG